MAEEIAIISLILLSLILAFFVGRFWNETPRKKRIIRMREPKDSPERLIQDFVQHMRKPSRAIRHVAHQLELEPLNEKLLGNLGKIGKRMDSMMQLLVAYAELGEHELIEDHCDLGVIAHEVIKDLAAKKELAPRVQTSGKLDFYGDSSLIYQLFLIVFRNLVADSGDTVVEIGGLEGERGGFSKFFLRVHHSSEAIDRSNPFILYNNRRLSRGGNGRGLAFVKKIINLHSGNIWLQQSHDGSLLFWYTLPVEEGVLAFKK